MDLVTFGEYALKVLLPVGLRLKKLYTSEVDSGITEAFDLALSDWSEHDPTTNDKLRLRNALEEYIQSATSYEDLDEDTRAFIDFFQRRLSEQPAAHNYLMMLRADKLEEQGVRDLQEHHKTQDLLQSIMSTLKEEDMSPEELQALLKELPLKEGLEQTESTLGEMLKKKRIPSERVKGLVLEFVRFLFEYTDRVDEEARHLREAGYNYLAETLEEIKRVLTGESKQSLTAVYEKYQEQAREGEIKVLKELIEGAQLQFSFGEACKFYKRLIELAPTVDHHFEYAHLLQSLNNFNEARSHYEVALQVLRSLAEHDLEAYTPAVATTLNNLGTLLKDTNEFEQSQTYYEEALQLYRSLASRNPEAYIPDVAMTLNNLGILLSDTNEFEQSLTYYEEALQLYRSLSARNPEAYTPAVAMTLNNLGALLRDTNEFEQSQTYYEEALQIRRSLASRNPEAYTPAVAATLNNLGALLSDTHNFEQSQTYFEEALQIRRSLASRNPEAYTPAVAMTLYNLVFLYIKLEREKDAEGAYQEAYDIYQRLAHSHPIPYEIDYAEILVMGAYLLDRQRKYLEEAKAILDRYPEHPRARKILSSIE
ncbi:tetratricopeptide repeat protein [uncultured Porphyromonas sp.]|uniref:tetratricopeptide repeat protein n=1 Tax=uncultured Porphyromonas sp. TaxID=159274 RepID=UPI0026066AEE|nr:tetratricopeptide repeat protein [uncultured Porphyromonas sp.]